MGANQYNLWADDQTELLKEIYPNKSTSVEMLENVFKRKIKAIRSKANREGLIRDRQYKFNEDYFHEIDSEEKAYFLGFISADGSIKNRNKGYYVRFYGHAQDIDIFEKFRCCVGSNKGIKQSYRYNRPYAELVFGSKVMVNDLIKLGVTPNKTFSIMFPNIKKQYYRHYIRGYFDGDGSIFKMNTGRFGFSIVSGSKSMIESIYNILGDVTKINTSIRTDRAYEIKTRSIPNLIDIYYYLYEHITMFGDRKKARFDEFIRGCGLHPLRVNLSERTLCDTNFVQKGVVA